MGSNSPGKGLKVAIVCNSLLRQAGVERRSMDLVRYLVQEGYKPEVLVLREVGSVGAAFEALGARVRWMHVYDYTEGEGTHHLRWSGLVRLWLALWRFPAIICVQPPSYIFGRLAALPLFGRRVVAMERFLIGDRSPRRLALDKLLANLTTRVVCVSTLLRDDLVAKAKISPEKVVVIEDGVAVEPVFDSHPEIKQWINGRFVFGYIGLLESRKRPRLVIEAFAELVKNGNADAALILVGAGEQECELKQLCTEQRIDDKVLFAGEQEHPHDFYRLFNAFIFPSVKEGLGNVWVEAMMHRLPVVCADVRPMSDYITHGKTGILCPPDDKESLCDAMRSLLDNPALRAALGDEAQAFANKNFDRDIQIRKLLALVEKS